METPSSVLANAEEQVALVRTASKPDDLIQQYDDWSKYDEHMQAVSYCGPQQVAAAVAGHLSGRTDVSILDVGAGTGAVAFELRNLGYTHIDALDPSEGMLQIAKEKGLYQKYFPVPFTDDVECITTSFYDVIVTAGSIGFAHMQLNVFPEMIRCVKTGGLVIVVMNAVNRSQAIFDQLQDEGKWCCLEKNTFPNYLQETTGVRYIMKVTK